MKDINIESLIIAENNIERVKAVSIKYQDMDTMSRYTVNVMVTDALIKDLATQLFEFLKEQPNEQS
jgi:hypothetical protein